MTQIEKILTLMIRRKGRQEWFYAPDFQKPDLPPELFVGYEASARISDLVRDCPELVQYKREGKYRYIRFRFDNIRAALLYGNLPPEIKNLVVAEVREVEGRLI